MKKHDVADEIEIGDSPPIDREGGVRFGALQIFPQHLPQIAGSGSHISGMSLPAGSHSGWQSPTMGYQPMTLPLDSRTGGHQTPFNLPPSESFP